ncbi:pilus assembly PilX family protein [Marinicella rhabdoformis]|uniref:pilus assembly PilX family protein n=1 Tax=Marinicella rhabdoformis TaxID=2580566 RepID=UPI0015CF9FBE|nr:PilX N-terminal domain-containing pilus assembly protein [Marinicella rhabdoformis]
MQKQEGAALIVGLMLLVIITLMGYTSMKGTMLQEKMAAGLHNRTLAQGGANTAVRNGESFIYNLVNQTNGVQISGTPNGSMSNIYSYYNVLEEPTSGINTNIEEFSKRNWNSTVGTIHDHNFTTVHVNAKLKTNPQYIIYELPFRKGSSGSSAFENAGGSAGSSQSEQKAFAVLGKSDSGDGKTFSLVRSLYTAVVSSGSTN